MNRFQGLITKPDDFDNTAGLVTEAIVKFEDKLKTEEQGLSSYELIIPGELHLNIRLIIEKEYSKAGWINVHCSTSAENGERPGLTMLMINRPKK